MSQDSDTQPARSGRITIRTVAEHSGVSVAAVSKVLRNAYGVSAALRARVEASIAELDYRPNASARGLRGQTYTIGILMVDIGNPFYPDILAGIDQGLENTQYVPLFGIGRGRASLEAATLHAMIDRQMDGIILVGQRLEPKVLAEVARNMPIVIIAHHDPNATGFDTVNNDDLLGGRLVVEHLLAQGYRRPAMITTRNTDMDVADVAVRREMGFSQAMQAVGLGEYIRVERAEDALDDVTATVRKLLTGDDPPDALFGWADYYALEVLSAVRALGYRVPEDVGLIGYDNSEPCAFTQNDLTSIDQSGREIGRKAAQLLLERIGGRTSAVHFLTQPRVVARGTTAGRSNPAG